jgi:hypothetical protein
MAGLDPAIQVLKGRDAKDVDARHKAGHDEIRKNLTPLSNRARPVRPCIVH